MNALAHALIEALRVIDFAENMDDAAVEEALDDIASILQSASDEERHAIESALQEDLRRANEEDASEELIDFYETFPETFLGDE